MLNGNGFLNGELISVADINLILVIKWAMLDLGFVQMNGFTVEDLPRIHKW